MATKIEYERTIQAALAELNRVIRQAWQEFQLIDYPAIEKYKSIKEAAYAAYVNDRRFAEEYERIVEAAWAEYERTTRPAREKYESICQDAEYDYMTTCERAREEYERANAH